MSKRLISILHRISKDIKDTDFDSEEIIDSITYDKEDLLDIWEAMEESVGLDEDSLDVFNALLVYLLIRDTSFEKEYIYSLIFGKGKNIVWH